MSSGKGIAMVAEDNKPILSKHYFTFLSGCFVEDPHVNRANGTTPMGRGSSWGIAWECCRDDDSPEKDLLAPGWAFCRWEPTSDDLTSSERKLLKISHEDDILNKVEAECIANIVINWRKKFYKSKAINLFDRIVKLHKEQKGVEPPNVKQVKKYIRRIAGPVTKKDMVMCLRKMEIP